MTVNTLLSILSLTTKMAAGRRVLSDSARAAAPRALCLSAAGPDFKLPPPPAEVLALPVFAMFLNLGGHAVPLSMPSEEA
jgi:hypothetical protein